jgi:hypothetical protein
MFANHVIVDVGHSLTAVPCRDARPLLFCHGDACRGYRGSMTWCGVPGSFRVAQRASFNEVMIMIRMIFCTNFLRIAL